MDTLQRSLHPGGIVTGRAVAVRPRPPHGRVYRLWRLGRGARDLGSSVVQPVGRKTQDDLLLGRCGLVADLRRPGRMVRGKGHAVGAKKDCQEVE